MVAASIITGSLFTAVYAVEAFFLLVTAIHGSLWPGILGLLFAVVASIFLWSQLSKRANTPLGPIVGKALAMAALPPIAFMMVFA